jgi:CheY-specific phosphatase CheX
LIVFFYFTDREETREHFARMVRMPLKSMDDKAFYDAVSEFGNLCCGSMNRDLGRHFPHVGMSTPNILKRGSVAFLGTLDAEYTQHFRIEISPTTHFHATICVCDYGDLDFHVEAKAVEENIGELELF